MDSRKQMSVLYAEKDIDSIVTDCNPVYLHYLRKKSINQVVGCSDKDFPWSRYADIYRKHELDAMKGNHYSIIFPGINASGDESIFLHTKTQRNNDQNQTIGVACHVVELIDYNINKLLKILNEIKINENQAYFLGKNDRQNLSNRQREILFFLVRGKTAKSIASFLNLSFRTIESYIDNLKQKLNCHTKSELIDYAIEHGFLENIPHQHNIRHLIDILEKDK